jgi:hypothetical protein
MKNIIFIIAMLFCPNLFAATLTTNTVPYVCQGGTNPQLCSSNLTTDSSGNLISGGFGAYQSINVGTVYQAASDGIVEVQAYISTPGGGTIVTGYTDSSSSPSTRHGTLSVVFPGSGQSDHTLPQNSFSMSVRKGEYYLVSRGPIVNQGATSDSASVYAYFRPLGV